LRVDLRITTNADDTKRQILVVEGSVDLASRDDLVRAGQEALERKGMTALVLDLGQVDFMDSTGIGALVGLASDASDAGAGFALRGPSPRVRRVLQVSGLLDAWPVEDVPLS
jgi:anti-sigma B factor antagonist